MPWKGDIVEHNINSTILPQHPNIVKSPGSQCQLVLRHLRDHGSITSLEAVNEYGIMRLASRISDLKRMGHPIRSEFETRKNRYGEFTNYVRYYLEVEGR